MDVNNGEISLEAAFSAAVSAAEHLLPADGAAVEAARALARKVDAWDQIVEWALDDAAESEGRPKVPQNDNVSLPSFLKYCEALGLTPSGRGQSKVSGPKQRDQLAEFREQHKVG